MDVLASMPTSIQRNPLGPKKPKTILNWKKIHTNSSFAFEVIKMFQTSMSPTWIQNFQNFFPKTRNLTCLDSRLRCISSIVMNGNSEVKNFTSIFINKYLVGTNSHHSKHLRKFCNENQVIRWKSFHKVPKVWSIQEVLSGWKTGKKRSTKRFPHRYFHSKKKSFSLRHSQNTQILIIFLSLLEIFLNLMHETF